MFCFFKNSKMNLLGHVEHLSLWVSFLPMRPKAGAQWRTTQMIILNTLSLSLLQMVCDSRISWAKDVTEYVHVFSTIHILFVLSAKSQGFDSMLLGNLWFFWHGIEACKELSQKNREGKNGVLMALVFPTSLLLLLARAIPLTWSQYSRSPSFLNFRLLADTF